MTDENNNTPEQPGEVVEVSESELNDLGDFLAQVQIVLLGHEQRIGAIEAFLNGPEDEKDNDGSVPDEGDITSADRRDEDDGEAGEALSSDEPTDPVSGSEPA